MASGSGETSFGGVWPSRPLQDLSADKLIATAPRYAGEDGRATAIPALGGIPLLAKLGQGGMGTVYYGIHPRLALEVAVKVLPFHLAEQQPDLVRRFYREAQAAARVKSPNLVTVLDVNEDAGLFYLVMEYVAGLTGAAYLKSRVKAGETGLPESEALDICIAATQGLAKAHAQGLVHRDVKPDNILVPYVTGEEEGAARALAFTEAKLADLGLARGEELGQSITGTAQCMGTPGYMAPEQADDARSARKPADVFAMGATLYAFLAGQAPYRGTSLMQVLTATRDQRHAPLDQVRPDVSPPTAALVAHCLVREPRERFPDGSALLAALRECRASLPLDEVARHTVITQVVGHINSAEVGLPVATPTPEVRDVTPGVAQVVSPVPPAAPPPCPPESQKSLPSPQVASAAHQAPQPSSSRRGLVLAVAVLMVSAIAVAGYLVFGRGGKETPGGNQTQLLNDNREEKLPVARNEPPRTAPVRNEVPQNAPPGRQPEPLAAQALAAVLPSALAAKEKGAWQDVVTALEGPLQALRDAPHPNRALAEKLLADARAEIQKRADFAAKIAEANGFLAADDPAKAKTAFEAAQALWPEAPAAELQKVSDGLQAAYSVQREKQYRAEMTAGKTALDAGQWAVAEGHYHRALGVKLDDVAATEGLKQVQAGVERDRQQEAAPKVKQDYEVAMADAQSRERAAAYAQAKRDYERIRVLAAQGAASEAMVAEARARVEVLSAPAKPLDLDRQQAAARAMNVAPEVSLDLGNNVKLGVVLIPSGTFLMGSSDGEKDRSDDEGPQHEVTISKAFYMGKYEVTQEQYEAVMGKSESRFKGLTNPAEFVSWDDAQEFCKKLSAKMGRTVRLPTEAEWEYACRAGTTTPFYTGETITTDQANFAGNINYGSGQKGEYRQKTVPVGSFPPNAFGLYDMYGNVWEWCQDWYAEKYEAGAATDPGGPANGTKRVMRGSCWTNYMASCRAASRAGCEPSHASDCTGFRCVLDVK